MILTPSGFICHSIVPFYKDAGDSVVETNLLPTYITGIQGWAEAYLNEAGSDSDNQFSAYTGATYASQNQDELDGITAVAVRGRYGSAVELDGKAHLRDLFDGEFVNHNEFMDDRVLGQLEYLYEEFVDEVEPAITNAHIFAFGGSDHNAAEAIAAKKAMRVINRIAKVYYEGYVQERQLQQQGIAHATPYGLQCIRDMEMLRQSGIYAREYLQSWYKDDWEKWNYNVMLPATNLDILGNAVRTILSTSREVKTKYYKPPLFTQIAGAAIAGLGIYSLFGKTSASKYDNAGENIRERIQSNYKEVPSTRVMAGLPPLAEEFS